jgi:catechol 2,3-dioxygenase-like lactoylglutathione lyase family enzyme
MNIVVDCPEADISARFWAAVLGWERVQENAGWVDIADASDGRRRLVADWARRGVPHHERQRVRKRIVWMHVHHPRAVSRPRR